MVFGEVDRGAPFGSGFVVQAVLSQKWCVVAIVADLAETGTHRSLHNLCRVLGMDVVPSEAGLVCLILKIAVEMSYPLLEVAQGMALLMVLVLLAAFLLLL